MKHLLLVLVSLFFVAHLFTQNIEQEYIFSKEHYNKTYTALNVNETTYLGGSMLECKRGAVSAISHDNNLLFNDTIPQDHDESFWHVSNLKLRESDSIIIGSGNWNITFDVGSPEIDGHYIFGMDLNGNKLFENHLPGIYSSSSSLTLIPSGMVLQSYTNIIWLNALGEIQNTISYNSSFKGVEKLDDNTLLAYGNDKILFMDYSGVVLDSIVSNIDILDLYLDDTNIYFLRQNDLMIYDIATTSITYSTNHLSSINTPENIIGNSTSLFIYGGNGYPNDQVVQLDKNNLSVIDVFNFDQEETEIRFIIATEDELQLIGEKDNYQSFIKSKKIINPLQYENIDIGISNIVPLDTLVAIDSTLQGLDFLYEFEKYNIDFSFDVTNHGTVPITSFSIVSNYNQVLFGCELFLTSKYFDNINILPGETETFISTYDYRFYYWSLSPSFVPPIMARVFAPNHKFDGNEMDNILTGSSAIFTNTEEINSLISSWNIFPNPTNGYININALLNENQENLSISIFDSQGRKIKTKNIQAQGMNINEKIQVEDLPNGIYWLGITKGNKIEGKSFIIMR